MKVKIFLDPDETVEQAQEELAKALNISNSLDNKEKYHDPLAESLLDDVNSDVKSLFRAMFSEIGQLIAVDIFGSKLL